MSLICCGVRTALPSCTRRSNARYSSALHSASVWIWLKVLNQLDLGRVVKRQRPRCSVEFRLPVKCQGHVAHGAGVLDQLGNQVQRRTRADVDTDCHTLDHRQNLTASRSGNLQVGRVARFCADMDAVWTRRPANGSDRTRVRVKNRLYLQELQCPHWDSNPDCADFKSVSPAFLR